MAKSDNDIWKIIGTIVLIFVIIWGYNNNKFSDIYNFFNPAAIVQPDSDEPVFSSCSQVCTQQGFSKSYSSTVCKEGESKVTYGYPNQAPLLTCCCYNEQTPSGTCVDSDGDNRDTPGNVKYGGETYMDKCLDVGQGVTEYICESGIVKAKNWACDYGEVCIQSRSGGYCKKSTPTWSPGDTVISGSGSGSLVGATNQISSIDLADYGITTDGNCRLGAQIQTSWSYANNYCTGIQGMEGVTWKLYDSNGLEYSRTDSVPVSLGVDLHPEEHILNWDGQTNWIGEVSKTLNLPNCIINYEYSVRIYIYDCI